MNLPESEKKRILGIINSLVSNGRAVKEVSLIFVSAKKMSDLNKKYRGRDGATNILTFDEGDIILCPEVIKKEAKERGFTQKKWMTRLAVHGILHLAGYGHGSEMERMEEKILAKLEIRL